MATSEDLGGTDHWIGTTRRLVDVLAHVGIAKKGEDTSLRHRGREHGALHEVEEE